MKYPNLYAKFFGQPLLLRDVEARSFQNILIKGLDGVELNLGNQPSRRVQEIYSTIADVATISIHGVIDKKISDFEMECYGGCDLDDIDKALRQAHEDDRISTIVLDIHSPGGSVTGVPETGERIAKLARDKEVHAYVSTMATSAGYWLASQADSITATHSAIVGSIGVYMACLDVSRAMDKEGIAMQMIKAGKWKDTGSAHRALTDEEREKIQERVNRIHEEFKATVTIRRMIEDDLMEGQWMMAEDAQSLVNELTDMTLEEFVESKI
jgi:signal peptide peptidase SppA